MNIFYLDLDIEKCAQAHVQNHVNKMILEGAQLLASAHHLTNPDALKIPGIYRLTHKNHPDAIWVRSSIENYNYLLELMKCLNVECQFRFEHKKTHLSLAKALAWPTPDLPNIAFTDPPKCVHDDFKNEPDTVEAYRKYYRRDKSHLADWGRRSPPSWYL